MAEPGKLFALVGNPNSGKTTIFNGLTGGHHRIGNWPGVTVEKRQGRLRMSGPGTFLAEPFLGQGEVLDAGHTVRQNSQRIQGGRAEVVDLPGLYGMAASTEDERVARDYLLQEAPDLVVNIVDGSNLERNLYLTLQLIELGHPLFVVVTMMDVASTRGISIDLEVLSRRLGVPVLGMQGTKPADIRTLSTMLCSNWANPRAAILPEYPNAVEQWIHSRQVRSDIILSRLLEALGPGVRDGSQAIPWLGIQVLENPALVRDLVGPATGLPALSRLRAAAEALGKETLTETDMLIAEEKYRHIESICSGCLRRKPTRQSRTDSIDRLVMNKFLGIPIFLGVMYLVFWFTIGVGGAFIDFFDILAGAVFVDLPSALLAGAGAPEWLNIVLTSGIGTGLQTVATFVPIIFAMFFALSLLEDSGYMARAAFVMDRLMRAIGLPGKAFIPMIVGFGCTVPGIMGTRTLESTKDRFTTIFMTPFMSCGARLPVYALFVVALFPKTSGLVVFSLYLGGIFLAVLTGLLLKYTVFRGSSSHFVMELPPYHAPRFWTAARSSLRRVGSFVLRAGLAIVVAVGSLSTLNSLHIGTAGPGQSAPETSVLSRAGKLAAPIFEPMGIERENWPATVALMTGFFAKEVIVATLGSLYATGNSSQATEAAPAEPDILLALGNSAREAVRSIPAGLAASLGQSAISFGDSPEPRQETGDAQTLARLSRAFTPAQGYSYLLFVLIYTPCIAAVGAAIREMGRRWGLGLAVYLLVLAWAVSVLFYQIAAGGSLALALLAVAVMCALVAVFAVLGSRMRARRTKVVGQ